MSEYTVTVGGDSDKVVLPKASYKLVVTDVKFSPISEWPDWKVTQAVERHNEREDERKDEREKKGQTYDVNYVKDTHGLSLAESAQYVWFCKVVGGKHDGVKVKPIYTGITLNGKKEYRAKSNLYKVLDATMPDIEASIAEGTVDVQGAKGYPFMAQLDLTTKGGQKYVAFMQSDDHGQRDMAVALGGATEEDAADGEDIPF